MRRVRPDRPPYLKGLFYGIPGSGKTRFAMSAAFDPRMGKVLALDAGGNPHSISDYAVHPDIIELDSLGDIDPIYNWLLAGQPANSDLVKRLELEPPYQTLILDGVTDVQRLAFGEATGNKKLGPGTLPTKIERSHFGSVLAQMTTLAYRFFKLPMHVIVTALEREDKDEVTGSISYRPLLLGQSSTEVAGYAYIVSRLVRRARIDKKILTAIEDLPKDNDDVNVAFFRSAGKFIAKAQYGVKLDLMVDPTVSKLMDAIYVKRDDPYKLVEIAS